MITNVVADAGDIVGLVYVNGFAPEAGETLLRAGQQFPGSMLGEATLRPVPRSDGTTDLFIAKDSFHDLFCADVPARRPPDGGHATAGDAGGARRALGRTAAVEGAALLVPDRRGRYIIPAALQHYMAERAGAHRTIEIGGASHGATVSQPAAVAELILEAAMSPVHA